MLSEKKKKLKRIQKAYYTIVQSTVSVNLQKLKEKRSTALGKRKAYPQKGH